MKENSIEEDIKILENMNDGYTFKDCDICNNYNEKTKQCDKHKCMELQAIEHILSDYKKLQKENEELKNKIMEKDLEIIGKEEYTKASMKEIIEQYYTANEDCITKQRIEDIIDRIDYDIKKTKEIISNGQKNNYQITRLKAMNTKSLDIKKRLQELLESEE